MGPPDHEVQDPDEPIPLTKSEAEEWFKELKKIGVGNYEVRGIGPNNEGIKLDDIDDDAPAPTNGVAINNYTYPTCKNKKCNKAEINCWWCGGKL